MKGKIFSLICLIALFMSIQASALTTEEAVLIERLKYDPDGDGKVGLEVAVNALQIVAGIKQADYTNSLGMSFKQIPAGTFMMGSPTDELGRISNETLHQVTLSKSFYIQTTEVTQAQWETVMGSNPSYFAACGSNCPVEKVSWDDIQLFIVEMNNRGEGTYRLPTEAEWEYAARAGSTTALANGNITETACEADANLDAMGWYCGNSDSTKHPVAQKKPNAWGLFDMHGNVVEWLEDDWHDNYTDSPTDGSSWVDVPRASFRAARSGSWRDNAMHCRSANRHRLEPSRRDTDVGFRLVFFPDQ
ncbi:Sulfatase-modifying factor enzyme domain-containing protein [Desulfonema limicola]|uniref:Sulfatase-modifying factor enzyme domain-containing protein n=1 Tax=Desulfonema limicola TaxID=45656 RepID=A0A975GIJ7_9BACT|nr:formylglycine-generating enzyme family protein [Desulfonema limicola]QTA82632.1 Sulfatase-modifying factor enzyme domain-containing protein [Desulfonema limicola]